MDKKRNPSKPRTKRVSRAPKRQKLMRKGSLETIDDIGRCYIDWKCVESEILAPQPSVLPNGQRVMVMDQMHITNVTRFELWAALNFPTRTALYNWFSDSFDNEADRYEWFEHYFPVLRPDDYDYMGPK